MMGTYTFQQYWGYAKAVVKCRECGAPSTRNIKEYNTVNPFNKNEDGSIRTPAEVRICAQAAAEREAARQEERGRICRKCEPKEPTT